MLKWLLFILVCLFVFTYPEQAFNVVYWVASQMVGVVYSVRDAIGIPVPPNLLAPC